MAWAKRQRGNAPRGGKAMQRHRFFSDTRAATAIEYGLIVALIALAIMGALRALGGGTGGMWTFISDEITEATNKQD